MICNIYACIAPVVIATCLGISETLSDWIDRFDQRFHVFHEDIIDESGHQFCAVESQKTKDLLRRFRFTLAIIQSNKT
jgi:hypothetical protein